MSARVTTDLPPAIEKEPIRVPSPEEIAARAYERFQQHGRTINLDDWLEAESELLEAESELFERQGQTMRVKEIMSRDPSCCTPDTNLQDVAKLMRDRDCGEIPVVERFSTMRVVGVVTDRDITCRTVAAGKNPLELSAKDCMSDPVITVTADMSIEECVQLMEAQQVRRVPVVDGERSCRGIVSQADLARCAPARQTAELLAEVSKPSGATARAS